jgi:hypothetical protein
VDNRFTTEPNRPHLFVAFYWVIGKTAQLLHVTPERVYAYVGVPLAFVLVLLLYATVRYFLPGSHAAWWTFLAILLGGGLGAHMKIANELAPLQQLPLFRQLVTDPLNSAPVFEEYRSHYVVKTLLDSHFLLIWIVSLASVLAFYASIRRGTLARHALAASLFAGSTFLHVYEGVTLMAIAAGIAVCSWPLREYRGAIVRALLVCGVATGLSYAVLVHWISQAGIPMSTWRAVNVLFATLLIAYPVAFGLIAWGWRDYWRTAGLHERMLVGWALGCTALTLSAPFYPYPDRGTMTMQVPLTLIAGAIYFARWPRLSWKALLVGVALMGATPLWLVARSWKHTGFREDTPFMFLNAAHRDVLSTLAAQATAADVLVADGADLLWLAPTFPGRHYAGHFFLTVDYDRKQRELERLLTTASAEDAKFVTDGGFRWLFVNSAQHPERFAALAGFTTRARTAVGWLFEVRRPATP